MLRNSGILRDKTMNDEFIYTPNDNKQNYPLFIKEILVQPADRKPVPAARLHPTATDNKQNYPLFIKKILVQPPDRKQVPAARIHPTIQ